MPIDKTINLSLFLVAAFVMAFATLGFVIWDRERQRELKLKLVGQRNTDDFEMKRLQLEERRLESERLARQESLRAVEERLTANNSGAGSGGYIVVEMVEKERPLFHDLLKGFEDYAKLKGYDLAFSIDSSFDGRIAFKFTVKNNGLVVGSERVRQDFKDYVEQVRNKDIEFLDHMPVITSAEEHTLLVALLKNRISFLQNSYNLSRNAVRHYESLIAKVRSFPALPGPSTMLAAEAITDSQSDNSSHLIEGNSSNSDPDSSPSIDIGESFTDRQARILALDEVLEKLSSSEAQDGFLSKTQRDLWKVRDELAEYPDPDRSSVKKWLESTKSLMGTATLNDEVMGAGKKLYELFGV